MKLKCLEHVPTVISSCTEVATIRQTDTIVRGKAKSRIYTALVHEVSKGIHIRVIIGKMDTGKHHFLSVMYHNNNSRRNSKLKSTSKGAL